MIALLRLSIITAKSLCMRRVVVKWLQGGDAHITALVHGSAEYA